MEIDVSAWTVIRDEPGGHDKNKRWIAEDADAPRDQHWLWKYRQTTGDGSEAALTDCAEVFTSRLAAAIDLPVAECRFAILDGRPGLISRNVTPHVSRRCDELAPMAADCPQELYQLGSACLLPGSDHLGTMPG